MESVDGSRRPMAAGLIRDRGKALVEDDVLLSEADARALLPIGRTLFRELAAQGQIASCRVGRRRLYSRQSVQRYIAERLRAELANR